jgi:hypothetical protein
MNCRANAQIFVDIFFHLERNLNIRPDILDIPGSISVAKNAGTDD